MTYEEIIDSLSASLSDLGGTKEDGSVIDALKLGWNVIEVIISHL